MNTTLRRRAPRIVMLVTATLAAASLAGCGGGTADDGQEAPPPAATADAEPAETEEPAPEPAETEEPARDVPATWSELQASITAAQTAAGSGRFETTMAGDGTDLGVSQAVDFTVGPDGGLAAMRFVMTTEGVPAEIALVDGVLYMGLGAEAGGMFLSMTREEMASEPDLAPLLPILDGITPSAGADFADDAVKSFTHAEGDGVDVFTVELDPTRLDVTKFGLPEMDEAALGEIESWVSEMTVSQADGLPQQTVNTLSIATGETLVTTVTFSQWGQVTIAAPPADTVIPFAEMNM